jgi:phosphate starvation-inducible PhoH-like protein
MTEKTLMEKTVHAESSAHIQALFGSLDENVVGLQKHNDVHIFTRGTQIDITGRPENVEKAVKAIKALLEFIKNGRRISKDTIRYVSSVANEINSDDVKAISGSEICLASGGKVIRPKTIGQRKYTEDMERNTIVFGVGPAGTGKTYLAVAMAVKAFKAREVSRIILTRPAVEAGEKLGFLPGDMQDKVSPYLKPLYDALFEMLGEESFQKHLERGSIEVAPLAFMRGRTLSNAFIILDEAQNTTAQQLKMFLTRLGNGSKMVITGDITQIDLPGTEHSGLAEAMEIFKDTDDIAVRVLTDKDISRNKLVQDILAAYERYHEKT